MYHPEHGSNEFGNVYNIILNHTVGKRQIDAKRMGIENVVGLVLAQDIISYYPVPSFNTSMKDGFAVRSSDGRGVYPVVGRVRAGFDDIDKNYILPLGTISYVATGAPIPIGADAVVPIEDTIDQGISTTLRVPLREIRSEVQPGQDVRTVGSDCAKNELLLKSGTLIGATEIEAIAMSGYSQVSVFPRPVVGVLSMGNQFIDVSSDKSITPFSSSTTTSFFDPMTKSTLPTATPFDRAFDSNRPMLLALASDPGAGNANTIDFGIIPGINDEKLHQADQPKINHEFAEKIMRAIDMEVDILILSGGISEDDRNFIRSTLEYYGMIHVSHVNIKPGKPLTFATIEKHGRRLLVFGVPSNPASAFVLFQTIIVPVLRKMAGWKEFGLRKIVCEATEKPAIHLDASAIEFHRGTIAAGVPPRVASTGNQRSSKITSLLHADCLMQLPTADSQKDINKDGTLPKGSLVECVIVRDLRHSNGFQFIDESSTTPKVIYPTKAAKSPINLSSKIERRITPIKSDIQNRLIKSATKMTPPSRNPPELPLMIKDGIEGNKNGDDTQLLTDDVSSALAIPLLNIDLSKDENEKIPVAFLYVNKNFDDMGLVSHQLEQIKHLDTVVVNVKKQNSTNSIQFNHVFEPSSISKILQSTQMQKNIDPYLLELENQKKRAIIILLGNEKKNISDYLNLDKYEPKIITGITERIRTFMPEINPIASIQAYVIRPYGTIILDIRALSDYPDMVSSIKIISSVLDDLLPIFASTRIQ